MSERNRIPMLDGWRAISILLVMAGHLLPLGPSWLGLNELSGAAGMAIFFCLSGFLIVTFLYQGMPVPVFLQKRIARIVPLAWTAVLALILWQGASSQQIVRNLTFTANLPPAALLPHGEHLWSLGVEMQFYLVAAALVVAFGRRGMLAVPLLCLAVTVARVVDHQLISIVTWHRVDEILAGGILALLYAHGRHTVLRHYPWWIAAILFIACSHPASGALQYLRPYAAAALVGTSLVSVPAFVRKLLESGPMAYIAAISYALYVIHAILAGTWLGTGDKAEKYLKRPFLIAATFALAHLSTRYLEQPFQQMGRKAKNNATAKPQSATSQ